MINFSTFHPFAITGQVVVRDIVIPVEDMVSKSNTPLKTLGSKEWSLVDRYRHLKKTTRVDPVTTTIDHPVPVHTTIRRMSLLPPGGAVPCYSGFS